MPQCSHSCQSPVLWYLTSLALALRPLCYADNGTANSQVGSTSWVTGAGNSSLGYVTASSSLTELETPGMAPSLHVKVSRSIFLPLAHN